jgi:hypothetical protein
MRGVLVGVAIGAEELGEIAAHVVDRFARNLRTLGGLGEDERALEDGLDEIADALGGPGRVGRIEVFGGLGVAGESFDMGGEGVFAGGAKVRVGGVGLLDEGAEQAGVVGQLAGEDGGAEVEVAEQAIDRVLGLVVGSGGEEASGALLPVLDGGEGKRIFGFASRQMSSTVVAA